MIEKGCQLEDLAVFARNFLAQYPAGGVFLLKGDLGAGKTTFVRKVLEELYQRQGQKPPRIISPTFVLHQRYDDISPAVDHIDLYRLARISSRELYEIGVLTESQGYVFIEWPERLSDVSTLNPQAELVISITGETTRDIALSPL